MTSLVELELLALMASRICHDLISPVGAIANGIEILAEEAGADGDADMRAQALDLIAQSAETAARRLTFCRMAFGSAGGANAGLDANELKRVSTELLAGGRVSLDWQIQPGPLPRNAGKIVLILVSVAADCMARGGRVQVNAQAQGSSWHIQIAAHADRRTIHEHLAAAFTGDLSLDLVDAKLAPAVYAGALARLSGKQIKVVEQAQMTMFEALS
jgi:histidine phosphotransferase ChpT